MWNIGLHGAKNCHGRIFLRMLKVIVALVSLGVWSFVAAQGGPKTGAFDHVSIGASDPEAWNGIVFDSTAYGQSLPFALRIGSKSGNNFLDGDRVFDAVSEVGPHAPNGSYARMSWRHSPRLSIVTLEWAQINATTVVGRLKAPSDIQLVLEAYSVSGGFPGGSFTGAYRISENGMQIIGDHPIDGHFTTAEHLVVATDRPITGRGTFSDATELRKVMDSGQLANGPTSNETGAAGLQFVTGEDSYAHFVATIGWDTHELGDVAKDFLEAGKIDKILGEKSAQYEQSRPHIQGLFNEAAEPIGNSMFWNTMYVPSLDLSFPSISRRWAKNWGGWVVGEWDCFFGSLLTNVEDTAQTSASIRAILLAQSPEGVVPNMASGAGTDPDRSQPPVGSYIVWKDYERNQDRAVLEWAYPRLKRWHQWWFKNRGDGQPWRDGNGDGLLEWGSDKGSTFSAGGRGFLQAAKWESGMDDSPMYDDAAYNSATYTMELDDVGLNSLYALDSECLAKIAKILGKEDDSRQFAADYERIKTVMQQKMWSEDDGIYENRYWNGRLSKRLSPTNFYPMLAGVATPKQAERMVKEHLLNPKEFWGKYVIPTIARNDPTFNNQFYWRGDIWGPTNYLVYEGLNRYGKDDVALQFAQKSYDLFMDDWHAHQHTDEQYYAWGGSAGGDLHYTWGALLCLIPMEQYIDETPWDGLRFGALNPPANGELSNVKWRHHVYDIGMGPDHLLVKRDGELRLEATGGVVVRKYALGPDQLTFTVKAVNPVNVTTRECASGTVSLTVDQGTVQTLTVEQGSVSFPVPAGEHRVTEECATGH
jgi:hypothetical protein